MKIGVVNNEVVVKGLWRRGFSAVESAITRINVMGDYKRNSLGLLGGRSRKTVCLRFLIIEAGKESITLDAFQDIGFELAVEWLEENDWDMNSGTNQALKTPLIRVPVSKLRRY
jgi:hypothetical protein